MQAPGHITFTTASTTEHFEQIIQLQKSNHHQALSIEEQAQSGFVFAAHTVELLKRMAAKMPQVVALCDGRVVGYNLSMDQSMQNDLPELTPMFKEFENCFYRGQALARYQFMVGGQVCVDESFRGLGLLQSLYHETRKAADPRFELCVTEISARNNVSLKAHQKMGFKVAGSYQDGTGLWNIVVWDYNDGLHTGSPNV